MEKPTPNLSTQDVLSGTTELLRCLMILMLAKGTLTYEEIDVAGGFAKNRLNSHVYDPRVRPGACAYVELFVHSLQMDSTPGKPH
jgi:hypothetical protein